jgi:2'-5' RNA ligase
MDDFFATLTSWWPPGRADLHWHLLPEPAVATGLTRHYRDLTNRPGLAPVGPHWCHVTVQDLAPATELTPTEVEAIVAEVGRACADLAPFELTLGPPEVGRLGLGCPVTPAAAATRLWEITVAASRQVTGVRFPVRPAPYHPHLSLAYGTASTSDDPLRAWLATHPARTATFTAKNLSLVAQSQDGAAAITWRPVATVSLTGRA